MSIGDARDGIEAASATVAGLRIHKLGEDISPPAVVVGPPRLAPLGHCVGPATATFSVFVIVAVGERMDSLLDLTTAVWEAIEEGTAGTVTEALPGSYASGTTELPDYVLHVEHPI